MHSKPESVERRTGPPLWRTPPPSIESGFFRSRKSSKAPSLTRDTLICFGLETDDREVVRELLLGLRLARVASAVRPVLHAQPVAAVDAERPADLPVTVERAAALLHERVDALVDELVLVGERERRTARPSRRR